MRSAAPAYPTFTSAACGAVISFDSLSVNRTSVAFASVSTSTDPTSSSSIPTQTTTSTSAECQTEPQNPPTSSPQKFVSSYKLMSGERVSSLSSFLSRVYPSLSLQLIENLSSPNIKEKTVFSNAEKWQGRLQIQKATDQRQRAVFDPKFKHQVVTGMIKFQGQIVAGYGRTDHQDWCVCTGHLCGVHSTRGTSTFSVDIDGCVTSLCGAGELIAVGTFRGSIHLIKDDAVVGHDPNGEGGEPIIGLQWSLKPSTATTLISLSSDGQLTFWKVGRENQLESLHRSDAPTSVCIDETLLFVDTSCNFLTSPGSTLSLSPIDGSILIGTDTGHLLPLQSHFGPVTSIAPHPHFPFILTSSTDSSIRLCRYDDPKTSSEAAKLSPTFVSSPPSLQQGKIILDFEGSRGANVPVHLVSWARTLPFSGVFLIAKRSEVFVYDCNIGALVISILLDQEGTDERMHVHGNAEPLCLFTLVEDDAGCVVAVGDSWGRVSFWNLPSWLRRDQDAQKIVSNLCN